MYMLPIAGGIADTEEYRFVFLFSVLKSLRAPGIPVNWIVGVLEEIRRLLTDQVITIVINHVLTSFFKYR